MSKKVLILQLRPNNQASNGEFQAFLTHGGLSPNQVERVRIEQQDVPQVDLDDYAALIIGGGPSNISDQPDKKSPAQQRFEKQLPPLLQQVIDKDFPYLGACYGFGALASCLHAPISKDKYSEDVGGITINLTQEAKDDPLLQGIPDTFRAFGGHKEACQELPQNAIHLASSTQCPIQMFRLKQNIYATQFHPELDVPGIITRINVYKHAGYFPPQDAQPLIDAAKKETTIYPPKILKKFVNTYLR